MFPFSIHVGLIFFVLTANNNLDPHIGVANKMLCMRIRSCRGESYYRAHGVAPKLFSHGAFCGLEKRVQRSIQMKSHLGGSGSGGRPPLSIGGDRKTCHSRPHRRYYYHPLRLAGFGLRGDFYQFVPYHDAPIGCELVGGV
jgi:hypothetical protein